MTAWACRRWWSTSSIGPELDCGHSTCIQISREATPEVLGQLHRGDVEAMEVYRGTSELAAEAVGDGCAAVYIWTRFGPAPDSTGH